MFYDRISDFFEAEGDFQENLVPEHAFQPGDGVDQYTDVCTECGHHLSEHEEGEPCCIAFVTSGGSDHEPDCKER